MSYSVKHPGVLVAVFLWLGFVCAISFMEAWIKFRAPGITLPVGVSIGRKVFNALNTVEWVFATIIVICLFKQTSLWQGPLTVLLWITFSILILQTVWLLPILDERATKLIRGETLPDSFVHIYYVSGEVIKSACLFLYGIKLFNP